MADIELMIKIPKEVKQAFDCAKSNDLKGCYYDHSGVIGKAIKNGTPLPEHHGRLIDADMLRKNWVFGSREKIEIDAAPTIIPATEEGEQMDEINLPIKHESKPYLMIPLPDGATNGDMIKALFNDKDYSIIEQRLCHTMWWNKPYERR